MIWIILLTLVIFCIAWCIHLTLKFRNKNKLYFVFGKKGSGKSTLLTKLAFKYNKKGVKVYCNTEIPGTYRFDAAKDIGFSEFDPGSVIMIDEVSLIWDNRNFKNFRPEVAKFFRLQRHHRLTVWMFSQTFDVDKKIRDLTDKMFMLRNYGGWLSYCKEIRRQLIVVEPTDTSEARIADTLIIPPWYTAIFGTRMFIYVPRWAQYFDSHIIEEPLQHKEYEYQPYAEKSLKSGKFHAIIDLIKNKGGRSHGVSKSDPLLEEVEAPHPDSISQDDRTHKEQHISV